MKRRKLILFLFALSLFLIPNMVKADTLLPSNNPKAGIRIDQKVNSIVEGQISKPDRMTFEAQIADLENSIIKSIGGNNYNKTVENNAQNLYHIGLTYIETSINATDIEKQKNAESFRAVAANVVSSYDEVCNSSRSTVIFISAVAFGIMIIFICWSFSAFQDEEYAYGIIMVIIALFLLSSGLFLLITNPIVCG